MRFFKYIFILFTMFLVIICFNAYSKEDPVEGQDYVWIDLGEENEGFLLNQKELADGVSEPDEIAGVDCRLQPFPYAGPGHNHMYFDIDDSFIFGGDHEVWIVMEYFDIGTGIDCQYDSNGAGPVDGAFRGSGDGAFEMLTPENTETWRFHVWYMPDGRFENRGNGCDFRFSTHGVDDMWINRVWVMLFEPEDPFDPDNLSRPKAVNAQNKKASAWAKIKYSFK
ncbi:hypothetical protein GF312_05280 [Candidatus Poribacteria bacterium]|nr:hypothetical protein [Candidatus Poribacteria bacterium]